MDDLEKQLAESAKKGHRFTIIVTDGVFSMDGVVANLNGICSLAEKYGALVMVDESHAAGFIGRTGRGTIEHCGVHGRVDIVTGTLGKALRRRYGRIYGRAERSNRNATPTFTPVPFLQFAVSFDSRRRIQSLRYGNARYKPA